MGTSKSLNFSEKQKQFALYNHALSHPARIAILEEVLSRKSNRTFHLNNAIPLSPGTVRQHLEVLVASGFVEKYQFKGIDFYRANSHPYLQWKKFVTGLNHYFHQAFDGEHEAQFDINKVDYSFMEEDILDMLAEMEKEERRKRS